MYDLRYAALLHYLIIHAYVTFMSMVNHPPKRRGYCDTVVRIGTPCAGTVRTCTSRTSGQSVIYSMCPYFHASTDIAVCYVQSSYSISSL